MEGNAALIAVFNRLADYSDDPLKKKMNQLYRCNSFLLQKDNKGHPRDGGGEEVYMYVL
jgi:hypothetical protein